MPKISMLEGYAGGQKFGLFCGEADVAMERLRIALDEASRVGMSHTDPRYLAGQQFYEQETSFWTGSAVMLPWQCDRVVNETVALVANLNNYINTKGGVTVEPPKENVGAGDYFKPVLLWGSVIAAVVVLGPPIISAVTAARARPKLAFVEGRRRRKKRRS